jgi:phosphatidate cytidylyltransferase
VAASELGRRVAVAAIGIPVVVAAVYAGGWVIGLLLAGAALMGAVELCRMAEQRGLRPFTLAAAVLAALLVLLSTALPTAPEATPLLWLAVLISVLALGAASIWLRGVEGGPLTAVATTVTAALLLGGTLSYAVFLRHLPWTLPDPLAAGAVPANARLAGALLVGFPLILTWVSDSGAYFGGRAFGRRKLIPSVSPGKTVAGAIAGVLSTLAAGAFYGWLLGAWVDLPVGWAAGAVGGALVSIVGQVGDLVESLLKREAGVKDSGALFPGHGGLLDRVDSLLFTFPVAYWFLSAVL